MKIFVKKTDFLSLLQNAGPRILNKTIKHQVSRNEEWYYLTSVIRAFVITLTQNHWNIHLFNIIEILNKLLSWVVIIIGNDPSSFVFLPRKLCTVNETWFAKRVLKMVEFEPRILDPKVRLVTILLCCFLVA